MSGAMRLYAALFGAMASLSAPTPGPAATVARIDGRSLGNWLDGWLPAGLEAGGVPGAVVVIVRDGRILVSRGYGHADVGRRRAMDPARTILRLGSLSKLVTATAVMQQVEAGRLSLDAPLPALPGVGFEREGDRPLTLVDLLTHSAGFDPDTSDTFLPPRAAALAPCDFIASHRPRRVEPAGSVPAYSNLGYALAGCLVGRAVGRSFEASVARSIFAPLGMRSASFAQPLPIGLSARLALGYGLSDDPPTPFEMIGPAPAGAMSATGVDMARFMNAHLAKGRGLFSPATEALMLAVRRRAAPGFNGMALGFQQEDRNGIRIRGQSGDTRLFHSDLHLLPDQRIGLFIAMNGAGRGNAVNAIRTRFLRSFLDRYFPVALPDEPALPSAAEHGRAVAGLWVSSRTTVANWPTPGDSGRAARLAFDPVDNSISFSPVVDETGQPKRWHEVAPFVWREVGGRSRLAIVADARHGRRLVTDDLAPVQAYFPLAAREGAAPVS